jgi:Putative peptidoglycan binding domain
MKTLLALICSFALISFAGAAQQDKDQNNNPKGKKEKGAAVVQQQGTGGGTKFNAQGTTTTRAAKFRTQGNARMIHDPTLNQGGGSLSAVQSNGNAKFGKNKLSSQTGVSANAASTKFNKGKFSSQTSVTGGGGGKFQKQHFNLSNKVSGKYKVVKFNQNYKIAGANKWQGAKYQVFVNYQPQWHDQYWWTSHHSHIVFFFGAPYYWDNGYCLPAWGYYPGANYYYDGPIYASSPDVDLGQEVANVQAALQEQGYYHGDIDGVLGPQTRAALADYQVAQGLEPTGTVDEATLETLGMA